MIIVVTGTPCTGKTELAKALAKKLEYLYMDVNKVIDGHKLIESYDTKRQASVVDEKKLAKILIDHIKKGKNIVIDSHLAHYIPKRYVDWCIVTKCDLQTLKKRMEQRKYSLEKIRENLDAEIFDVCLVEAADLGHRIIVLDTTKTPVSKLVSIVIHETRQNH